jgi:hypothetical protein
VTTLLWEPELSSSWWYLGLSAPHSHTPLDMLHTIGSAAAVIGAALLLTRVRLIARIVSPIAAAGSMSLTLYWAHLILLAFGVGEDQPPLLFLSMMVGALALAWVWRWRIGQGPLERLISETATSARRAVADRLKAAPVGPTLSGSPEAGLSTPERLAIRVLALVTCAGVLALALWGGAGSETAGLENPADAAEETLSEGFETVAPDGANITTPQAAPAQVPTLSPPAESAEVSAASAPGQAVADVQRYCELSRQLDAADEAEAPQLSELPQVAPPEIREAVTVIVDDLRAEADLPGATAPDEDTLEQAEATAEDFTARNC